MHHIEYSVCTKLNFETPQNKYTIKFFWGGVLIEESVVAHDIVSLLFDKNV